MKLKALWERYRAQHRALAVPAPPPIEGRSPKPFQPLTPEESVEILEHAIQWLIAEASATVALPNGPSKHRRKAELRARDKSMARDFARLMRERQS